MIRLHGGQGNSLGRGVAERVDALGLPRTEESEMTRVRRWVALAIATAALTAVSAAPASAGKNNNCRNHDGNQVNAISCNNLEIDKNKVKVNVL